MEISLYMVVCNSKSKFCYKLFIPNLTKKFSIENTIILRFKIKYN